MPSLFASPGLWERDQCGAICHPFPTKGISQSDPVSPEFCGECCGCHWRAAQSIRVSQYGSYYVKLLCGKLEINACVCEMPHVLSLQMIMHTEWFISLLFCHPHLSSCTIDILSESRTGPSPSVHNFFSISECSPSFSFPLSICLSVMCPPRWAHGCQKEAMKTPFLIIPPTTELMPGKLSGPSTLPQVQKQN